MNEKTQVEYHATGDVLNEKNTVILGHNDLQDILLDPSIKKSPTLSGKDSRWSQEVIDIDAALYNIAKKLSFSSLLRPTNYNQALSEFLESPHQYNPVFSYAFPSSEALIGWSENIKSLQSRID